jgi:hypothetical protein
MLGHQETAGKVHVLSGMGFDFFSCEADRHVEDRSECSGKARRLKRPQQLQGDFPLSSLSVLPDLNQGEEDTADHGNTTEKLPESGKSLKHEPSGVTWSSLVECPRA